MARKKAPESEGANWMDTYGDLVTLLLCFFVLLYSMSTMDVSKWQYIAQAFSTGNGDIINVAVTDEPNEDADKSAVYTDDQGEEADTKEIDFEDFYMYLSEAVASAGISDSVSIEMSKTGVYMKFRDSVFFAGDSAELLDEGKYILEVICDGVRAVNQHVLAIKVSGHTAESSSSSVDEWDLSSGRADSVIKFMLSIDCCEPEKFSAAGYGKYRPVVDNDTPENRRINRRVEIVFIRNDVDFSDPAVVQELLEAEFGESFVGMSPGDEAIPEREPTEEELAAAEEAAADTRPDVEYVSKDEYVMEHRGEGNAEAEE